MPTTAYIEPGEVTGISTQFVMSRFLYGKGLSMAGAQSTRRSPAIWSDGATFRCPFVLAVLGYTTDIAMVSPQRPRQPGPARRLADQHRQCRPSFLYAPVHGLVACRVSSCPGRLADSPRPAWSLAHSQPINWPNHSYDSYDLNHYINSNSYLNVDH
jgi:hypothetical protein